MGASMSAITPISKNPADLGEEYLGVSPPAIGAVPGAAASASHVHRVLAAYSEITGFGKMAAYSAPAPIPGTAPDPAAGYLFSESELTVPKEWTIELWATRNPVPANGPTDMWGVGWAAPDGTLPNSQALGFNGPPEAFMGYFLSGAVWPGGVTAGAGAPFVPPDTPAHLFVAMDAAGTLYAGMDGTLLAPVPMPAGSAPYSVAFPMIYTAPNGFGDAEGWQFDEVRISSTLRYPTDGAAYVPPSEPFSPDNETMVLWHLDDVPYGTFLRSSGNGQNVWVFGPTTDDSTLNAIKGIFAINDLTGQSTGIDTLTWLGENSNVAAGSGTGSAPNVQSIQGQTGNFLLVDPGGNPLDVSAPEGAQQIEVVGHLIGSPEYWY